MTDSRPYHAVTGAFGFSGSYIAERLLARGRGVVTLTGSPHRESPLQGRIGVRPFRFGRVDRLTESLRDVDVLYNTYWVRFNHQGFTHQEAVRNTLELIHAARLAGVRRMVHVSITNPSEDSPFEYFRGKAFLERALAESGLAHSILRPAVLFGPEDILINNIAWALRKLPLIGVFGRGDYRIRPIFVDDLAALAVKEGERDGDSVVEAVGPESFTYRELVRTIGRLIGRPRPVMAVPPELALFTARIIGRIVGDVFLTREEMGGLMAGLLDVDAPAAGPTRLTDWVQKNADLVGRSYHSELGRRKNRTRRY